MGGNDEGARCEVCLPQAFKHSPGNLRNMCEVALPILSFWRNVNQARPEDSQKRPLNLFLAFTLSPPHSFSLIPSAHPHRSP